MNTRSITAVLAAALALPASAQAAKDPIEVLIQRLQERNILAPADAESIRAEIAQIAKDNASEAAAAAKAARPAGQPVSARLPIRISGYVQARYTNTGQTGGSNAFEAKRVRVSLTGDAAPALGYAVQVDFAGSQRGLADMKGTTAAFGKAQLLDASLDYRFSPVAKLTVGQFKVPFSRESLANDALLDTINRAIVVDRLAPGRDIGSSGRDDGLQLSGTLPQAGGVDYALAVFNGSGINVSDENKAKDIAARAVWRPSGLGLSIGASHYAGHKGAPSSVTRSRTGLEASFARGLYGLIGEYIWGKDASVRRRGYYATGAFPVAPRTQGVLRYEAYNPNTAAADASSGWTAGLNRFLTRDSLSRIQLNYERHHDAGNVRYGALLAQFQAGF